MRDRLILEEPEKMCEYCCNFDKEHIGMDCTALCKLTMTLAYAEDYGGNCMFYNVPKEQIIVPPCKVGDTVYYISAHKVYKSKCHAISQHKGGLQIHLYDYDGDNARYTAKNVFLTKEEAEKALNERTNENE